MFTQVLMAIVWVGGVLVAQFYVLPRLAPRIRGRRMQLFGDIFWIGLHVFAPAAFVLVIAGVSKVLISDAWAFSQTWVWASLSAYVLSLGTGMAFIGPENGRLAALAAARGPADPEVVRRSACLLNVFLARRCCWSWWCG